MAIAYHTHTFEIPTATNAETQAGVITDKVVVPSGLAAALASYVTSTALTTTLADYALSASLGTAATEDVGYFATAAQGALAATAVQPTDIGVSVQAYSANLDEYAAVNPTAAGLALLDDVDAAAQRTTLGLGTMATQAAAAVAITGGSVAGITDLAVADGGTGASDAATARTNLGLVIGTDVQAYSTHTAAVAALDKTDGNFVVTNGTTFVAESGSTARDSLGLGTAATATIGTSGDTVPKNNTANTFGAQQIFGGGVTGSSGMATATGGLGEMRVRNASNGAAMMSFFLTGLFETYFGVDTDGVLKIGGASSGANAYKIAHEGLSSFAFPGDLSVAGSFTVDGFGISLSTLDARYLQTSGVSAFAATFLDDADAAAVRATLGVGTGTGDMVGSNNLSELTNAATARSNLGLGAAATAGFLDEDAFTTDSATAAPSQQSTKAYVDHRRHDRPSRADAIANFHPITAPDFIRTAGYAAAGDGGEALYEKAVSEPSHAGKLSITLAGGSTAWYEYVPGPGGINPLAIGVVMGATIDVNDVESLTNYADTTALAAATIGGSVEAVKVNGEPWRRIDAAHPRLGPELLVNYDFAVDASWTKGTGYTISAGEAHAAAGTASNLQQAYAFAAGTAYWVNFTLSDVTGGTVSASFFGGTTATPVNSTGTNGYKSGVAVALTGNTTFNFNKDAAFAGDIDNVSLRALPADAVMSADGAWWAAADLRYAPVGTGAVTGTDSRAAVVAAQAVSEALKVPIMWPSGDIRIVVPNGASQKLVQYGEWGLHWGSAGRTRFILDDNPAYTATAQTGNIFIASAQTADYTRNSRNINQKCILEHGIVIQGTWWRDIEKGGRSWTGAALPYRCHALWPTHTQTVRLDGVEIIDIMGFATNTRSCGQVIYTKSRLNRIAGDGFRAEDCDNVQIFGNYGLHVDDNVVALPDLDDLPNYAGPRRAGASVTGNVFESCRGLLVLGPAALDISHNILRRMYAGGIAAYTQASDVSDRGEGGFRTVTISHNLIEDTLKESDLADPPDGTWDAADAYALSIRGGTPATPTGEGTGTPATLPWASTTQAWGAMHVQDMTGADAVAGYRGTGLQCVNNTLIRTHQGGSYYSCMGYGKRFTRWGFDNPAIGDTEFALGGIQLRGDFNGARVAGNFIKGFPLGAGIYLARTTINMAFRNTTIAGNTIINVRHGLDCDASSTQYQGISIVGNDIDVDPYRIQPERAAGNKWTGGFTGAAPACIHLSFLRGLYIAGNKFKNAANPWTLEGGAIEAIQYNTLRDNIGYVDIGTGSSVTTTDSKFRGLGRIPFAGPMMTYRIQDLDPASGTFGQDAAGMLTYSVAMPTSGKYVVGHLITTNAGIYLRYLTGDAHVLNTDWKLM